jgi:hypothetical protein
MMDRPVIRTSSDIFHPKMSKESGHANIDKLGASIKSPKAKPGQQI